MTQPDFRVADVMRLLVESPGDISTGAANNLVKNPDGATGTWWWTRSNGTLLLGGATGLTLKAGAAVVVQAQTGYMPVTAGVWISSRFDVSSIANVTNMQAVYEFSDATRSVLSSPGATGAITARGTYYLSGVQAPAGASYVRVLFSLHHGSTGSAACQVNDYVSLTKVMVTTSDSNSFTTTRRNLMPNPSFETGTSGWAAGAGTSSISVDPITDWLSPVGSVGSKLLRVTPGGGLTSYVNSPLMPVTAGTTYDIQARMSLLVQGALTGGLLVRFFNSAGALVQETNYAQVVSGVAGGVRPTLQTLSVLRTAPPGSASMQIYPSMTMPDYNTHVTWILDAVMVEPSGTVGSYFDGDSGAAGGWVYSWDGTPGASTSTATLTTDGYDYVDPTEAWVDILGSANQIDVSRATLDTSTLTATVVDPNLDPSIDPNDLLKKGRRISLQSSSDEGTTWEPVYTGVINDAAVTYVLDNANPSIIKPKIAVSALDAASDLAALMSPNCYGTVAELPQAIDVPGNAHPWNCNGDTGISVSTTPISVDYQNQMSVLDQIATTRDTVSGLAFIDRAGVVNAWDGSEFVSPVSDTYSNSVAPSYSDLQVGYDESSIINAVRVVVNSMDASGNPVSTYWPGGGNVDPGTAGPISSYYVDQDSIDQHGLATATYTINMASPTAAKVQAYAQAVLTANSTPQRIVTSMTVPVLDADGISRAILTDLCSVIGIEYQGLTAADHRVQTITHSITAGNGVPDKWLVTYGFAAPEAVAAPQITPPAGGTVVAGDTDAPPAPTMYAAGNVVVTTNASGDAVISFGKTFPVAPTVAPCGGNGEQVTLPGDGVTTTGFTARFTSATGVVLGNIGVRCLWIALPAT